MTRATRHATALALIAVASAIPAYTVHDVHEYMAYAAAAVRPPWFTHWPVEYPPASILVMLPALAGQGGFIAAMAAAAWMLAVVLERQSPAMAARWLWLVALGAIYTALGRYDLWPALCTTLAVLAGQRRRWAAAWGWSLAAACLKLYGAVLWPVLLAAEWHQTGRLRWDRLGAAAGGFLLSFLLPALGAGVKVFSTWRWLLARPVEVESLAAPALAALGGRLVMAYNSVSLVSHWDHLAELVLTAGLATAMGWLLVQVATGRVTWERGAAVAVTWLVVTGKVLSAQYLLWLFPLWVLAWPDGLPPAAYVAAALTSLFYPVASALFPATPAYWTIDALRGLALISMGLQGWPWRTPVSRVASGALAGLEATVSRDESP
jgi:hypothetical protein